MNPNLMKISEHLPDFDHYLSLERGLSPNTVEGYSCDIRHLAEFLGDEEPADCEPPIGRQATNQAASVDEKYTA